MDQSESSRAQQIAQIARAFEQRTTGQLPRAVSVVLSEDTLVVTRRGALSPAEMILAENQEGAARLREFRRQLFLTAFEPLRQEIGRITGVEVLSATAEVDISSGTAVRVFSLARAVPADNWSGNDPAVAKTEEASNPRTDDGAGLSA